jgi:hypothetical protein
MASEKFNFLFTLTASRIVAAGALLPISLENGAASAIRSPGINIESLKELLT